VSQGRTIRSLIDARLINNRQSQAEAAAELGVSEATMSRWRAGEHVPDPKYLSSLADWLDMDRNELLAVWASEQNARPKPTRLDLEATVAALLDRVEALERRLRNRRR
jgi:transcriptional regulator with XRE-family HTH domain